MSELNPLIAEVIQRIRIRSKNTRSAYLEAIDEMAADNDQDRGAISCSNIAHAGAGAGIDQADYLTSKKPNIGIVTSYNDMLSAHQPFETFPAIIKAAARTAGATAQVAGGVPAMCDGVTQGRPGMELSLLSRDVIAMSTAVSLSHGVYDAALCLGVCDKIVPGLVIGALSFGHLPAIFIPAGPMSSGLPNDEKASVRKAFAKGEVGRDALLKAESSAYHGAGTCTFYGTANSNQMLMEIMGLHLPGAAFLHPHSDIRHALTVASTEQAVRISRESNDYRPIGKMLDERSFVNAIIGLHATGGSTNHTLHLPAMAAAAGIVLTWEDFSDLSDIIPLLTRIYPNGSADVNQFHAAGGLSFVIKELLSAGLLDGTAHSVWGNSIDDYASEPILSNNGLEWRDAPDSSGDLSILRPICEPHQKTGGLKMLSGNLGKAVIKVSAVSETNRVISAPAAVFSNEADVKSAYADGKLDRDVIVVVIAQGPQANGMPELHSLTPMLSNLQDKGFKVALVTDGRMSGASGKIPAAIHVSPEAVKGGTIGRIQDGDMITLDALSGSLEIAADLSHRPDYISASKVNPNSFARLLFAPMRDQSANAEAGGGINLTAGHNT
ncbi:MAG: phosphogluconate dehydratase [Alphaproteobacteria bacterium]|nr:phosphogluconate dehydratase [Alphaproteobacteria bacterium]